MTKSKFIPFFTLFLCILSLSRLDAKTASPYQLGDKLFPYSESDFFKNEKQLAAILEKEKVTTVIEIGSWFGQSTIFMASHLPVWGKVYAIDSWIGYPKETYEITRYVYERFLSNVIHANLTNRIIPIRMTSLSASRIFAQNYYKKKVDMIYIDGDHSYEAVYSDIKAWRPFIRAGGILCGNTYAKTEEEMNQIKQAVNNYCKDKGKTASFEGYFWRINL